MMNEEQLQSIHNDGVVVGPDGEQIGKVGQVYLDDSTGEPAWVTVKTGLFGTSESFVPLQGATVQGQEVRVPHTKDRIKDAPRVEEDGHISQDEERELFAYYQTGHEQGPVDEDQNNMTAAPDRTDAMDRTDAVDRGDGTTAAPGGRPTETDREHGHGTGGGGMVRSEEQLQVGTERVTTGRARLRKYVVTDHVTKTVPVQREEVRLEREPIDEHDRRGRAGAEIGEDEQEVTLSEERVVVDKETVPVEEVRLDTDTVTEDREVTEDVRKEQIDTDLPDEGAPRDR